MRVADCDSHTSFRSQGRVDMVAFWKDVAMKVGCTLSVSLFSLMILRYTRPLITPVPRG
jgi:hypothetical protein